MKEKLEVSIDKRCTKIERYKNKQAKSKMSKTKQQSSVPDKVHKINFNWLYLGYFFTKSYVRPLVRIVSMRRFLQVVKHRIWWRNGHYRNKNMHLIWSPGSSVTTSKKADRPHLCFAVWCDMFCEIFAIVLQLCVFELMEKINFLP